MTAARARDGNSDGEVKQHSKKKESRSAKHLVFSEKKLVIRDDLESESSNRRREQQDPSHRLSVEMFAHGHRVVNAHELSLS